MAITISGENNNDRILASDGVIDSLSGFNVVGVITATSFTGDLTGDVTGNLTGNVTGNINNTTLLLQTGGTERVRITSGGEVLIGTTTGTGNNLTIQDAGTSTTAGGNIVARFQSNGSGRDASIQLSDNVAHSALISMVSSNFAINLSGNERLRIKNDGTVHFYGNQTSTPEGDFGFRWDRNSNVNFQITNTNNTSVNAGGRITLKANIGTFTGTYYNNGGFYLINSANGYFNYYSNSILRLNIDINGNVTINPGSAVALTSSNGGVGKKFGIKSNANNVIIGETEATSNGSGLHIESRQSGRSGDARIAQIGLKNDAGGNGQISFFTAPSGAGVIERMTITSGGRTLLNNLGNATPGLSNNADDLVIGYGTQSGETGITMFSTTASGIRFNDNSGTDGAIEYVHSSRQLRLNAAGADRLYLGVNSNSSHIGSFGTGSSHINNATTPDRASFKVGASIHIDSVFGHNANSGMYYNCYSGGNDKFYRGTNNPSGGDWRAAAQTMRFGSHYFYGDPTNNSYSAQAEITSMQLNMSIAREGYVTKPEHPAFSVYKADHAGQVPAGVYVFNSVSWNKGNHYNTSNGRFTAPVAGYYFFHFTLQGYGGGSGGRHVRIQLNGTDYWNNGTNTPFYDEIAGNHHNWSMGQGVRMAQGDYVTVTSSHQHRGMQSGFSGFLVG